MSVRSVCGFVVLYLFLLAACWTSPTDAFSFRRSFRLKQDQPAMGGKIKHALKKVMELKEVPTLPPLPTLRPARVIAHKESQRFDPCKAVDLCANGGHCIAEGNEFYCECPPTHFGQTCQFVADHGHCAAHRCQHNATCYSVSEKRVVVNPDLKQLGANDSAYNSSTFDATTIEIQYECWCPRGFYGEFCEFPEALRHCVEEACSGHGVVDRDSSECHCHCEPFYSGPRCEVVSPCRDQVCTNNGTCELDPHGQAVCRCPQDDGFLRGSFEVSGPNCEVVTVAAGRERLACLPCVMPHSEWRSCLQGFGVSVPTLDSIFQGCQRDRACPQNEQLCLNGGTCSVIATLLPDFLHLLLVPSCECPNGFEGDFCQRRTPHPCDPGPREVAAGWSSRCAHGQCTFSRIAGLRCACDVGWKGVQCDRVDPCNPNPCTDSVCVEVTAPGGKTSFTCVCELKQDIEPRSQKCYTAHHDVCFVQGEPVCQNGGHCFPCALDSALCQSGEAARGYRCLCPSGFHAPFCRERMQVCDFSQCQHGGECVPSTESQFQYKCECKLGYEGEYCQVAPDACVVHGFALCAHGTCIPDGNLTRGFRCDCDQDWFGVNCHKKAEFDLLTYLDDQFWWSYPLFTISLVALAVALTTILRHKLSLKHRYTTGSGVPETASAQAPGGVGDPDPTSQGPATATTEKGLLDAAQLARSKEASEPRPLGTPVVVRTPSFGTTSRETKTPTAGKKESN